MSQVDIRHPSIPPTPPPSLFEIEQPDGYSDDSDDGSYDSYDDSYDTSSDDSTDAEPLFEELALD